MDEQNIAYERDPRLVRGLDYYSDAIFEMTTTALGSQDAILGGGRYDGLVESLGGPPTPAVGFGAGVERLALLMAQQDQKSVGPELFVIPMTPKLVGRALALTTQLRAAGRSVELDTSCAKIGRAMRRADKEHAQAVLVVGEDELRTGQGSLKRLADGQVLPCALTAAGVTQAMHQLMAQQP